MRSKLIACIRGLGCPAGENTPLWRHAYDLALSHFFSCYDTPMRNRSKHDCRPAKTFYTQVMGDRFGAVNLLPSPFTDSTPGYYRCIAILYVHPFRSIIFSMARYFTIRFAGRQRPMYLLETLPRPTLQFWIS